MLKRHTMPVCVTRCARIKESEFRGALKSCLQWLTCAHTRAIERTNPCDPIKNFSTTKLDSWLGVSKYLAAKSQALLAAGVLWRSSGNRSRPPHSLPRVPLVRIGPGCSESTLPMTKARVADGTIFLTILKTQVDCTRRGIAHMACE